MIDLGELFPARHMLVSILRTCTPKSPLECRKAKEGWVDVCARSLCSSRVVHMFYQDPYDARRGS